MICNSQGYMKEEWQKYETNELDFVTENIDSKYVRKSELDN